jgi:hypothetical protein
MNLIVHDPVTSCVICGQRNCDHLRQNIERIRSAFSYEMDETVAAAIDSLWSDPGLFMPYIPLHVSRVTQNGVHAFEWKIINTIADLKRVINGHDIRNFCVMESYTRVDVTIFQLVRKSHLEQLKNDINQLKPVGIEIIIKRCTIPKLLLEYINLLYRYVKLIFLIYRRKRRRIIRLTKFDVISKA